jgi:hypothetical protein
MKISKLQFGLLSGELEEKGVLVNALISSNCLIFNLILSVYEDKLQLILSAVTFVFSLVRDFIALTPVRMLKLFLICLLTGFSHARTSKDLKVRIESGRIIGRYLTSESGRTIRAFMGVPYTEPPVGDLRFRAPVKVKPWHGIFLAQKEPPMCLQKDSRSTVIEGQEDCLYLNVYASEVSMKKNLLNIDLKLSIKFQKKNASVKLPVMVFIHGGGNTQYSTGCNYRNIVKLIK